MNNRPIYFIDESQYIQRPTVRTAVAKVLNPDLHQLHEQMGQVDAICKANPEIAAAFQEHLKRLHDLS